MSRQSSPLRQLQQYLEGSSSPFFSAIVLIPLLGIYEAALFVGRQNNGSAVRNGVDVVFRAALGRPGSLDLGMVVAAGAVGVAVWRWRQKRPRIRPQWTGYFLLESVLWALVLLAFLRLTFALHLAAMGRRLLAGAGLISGAAVFEELTFRAVILGGLRWLFQRLRGPGWLGWNASLWTSSFAFAAAHYYGPFSHPLTSESLFAHIFVGLGLGVVYLLRGLAVAVYTHAFYDWFVLVAL